MKGRRNTVFHRDGGRCRYCGAEILTDYTLDHVVPRVQGGGSTLDNLVLACRPCNTEKGGRTPAEAGMELLPVPEEGIRYLIMVNYRLTKKQRKALSQINCASNGAAVREQLLARGMLRPA